MPITGDFNVEGQADTAERDLIIKTMVGEALGEGLPGMIAVGESIRNRSRARKKSPTEIVFQPLQYEFWNDTKLAESKLQKMLTPEVYQMAAHAYEEAFHNGSDTIMGATNYLNPELTIQRAGKLPSWASEDRKVTVVGNHHFFQEQRRTSK